MYTFVPSSADRLLIHTTLQSRCEQSQREKQGVQSMQQPLPRKKLSTCYEVVARKIVFVQITPLLKKKLSPLPPYSRCRARIMHRSYRHACTDHIHTYVANRRLIQSYSDPALGVALAIEVLRRALDKGDFFSPFFQSGGGTAQKANGADLRRVSACRVFGTGGS